ncbi:MAG: ArsR/SmtB family transcription factor [Blastomonas sp.]
MAALIGDPARANILVALMDGRALTVTELAQIAGVMVQTASGHLAKLSDAAMIVTEKQGRHRYVRLSGPDIAHVLEGLMGLAQRTGAVPARPGPRDAELRTARTCYDHLAGERGVELFDLLLQRNLIEMSDRLSVTAAGRAFFIDLGLDMRALDARRRPLCRACLDWSERRHHLGGALGAEIFAMFIERRWAVRKQGRVVELSPSAMEAFTRMIAG